MPTSKHQVPGRGRTTNEVIKVHRDTHSVEAMCRILEVAPSGYYDSVEEADIGPRAGGRPIASPGSCLVRRKSR